MGTPLLSPNRLAPRTNPALPQRAAGGGGPHARVFTNRCEPPRQPGGCHGLRRALVPRARSSSSPPPASAATPPLGSIATRRYGGTVVAEKATPTTALSPRSERTAQGRRRASARREQSSRTALVLPFPVASRLPGEEGDLLPPRLEPHRVRELLVAAFVVVVPRHHPGTPNESRTAYARVKRSLRSAPRWSAPQRRPLLLAARSPSTACSSSTALDAPPHHGRRLGRLPG